MCKVLFVVLALMIWINRAIPSREPFVENTQESEKFTFHQNSISRQSFPDFKVHSINWKPVKVNNHKNARKRNNFIAVIAQKIRDRRFNRTESRTKPPAVTKPPTIVTQTASISTPSPTQAASSPLITQSLTSTSAPESSPSTTTTQTTTASSQLTTAPPQSTAAPPQSTTTASATAASNAAVDTESTTASTTVSSTTRSVTSTIESTSSPIITSTGAPLTSSTSTTLSARTESSTVPSTTTSTLQSTSSPTPSSTSTVSTTPSTTPSTSSTTSPEISGKPAKVESLPSPPNLSLSENSPVPNQSISCCMCEPTPNPCIASHAEILRAILISNDRLSSIESDFLDFKNLALEMKDEHEQMLQVMYQLNDHLSNLFEAMVVLNSLNKRKGTDSHSNKTNIVNIKVEKPFKRTIRLNP